MSQENLDLVRSIYAAWERGDYSSAEWADPEIEYVMADGPDPGSWTGFAAMTAVVREGLSVWREYRVEADQFRELDEARILVLDRRIGRGKASGLDLAQMRAHLFCVRDAKVTKLVNYRDVDRALADLGLAPEGDSQRGPPVAERNVELTRRLTAAYNARDLEAFLAYCDRSTELHSALAAAVGTVYRGHEGVRGWHRDLEEAWGDEIRVEPQAYFDLGEHVLVYLTLRGRGKKSGVEVAMPVALVARWRDGLMVYFKAYTGRDDALRDLGVSEDELEPIAP
jgi:ketosteroid isomerase-like protein